MTSTSRKIEAITAQPTARPQQRASIPLKPEAFPLEPVVAEDGALAIEVIAKVEAPIVSANASNKQRRTKHYRYHLRTYPGNGIAIDSHVVAPEGTYTTDPLLSADA